MTILNDLATKIENAVPTKALEGIGTELAEVGAKLVEANPAELLQSIGELGPRITDAFEQTVASIRTEIVALLESIRLRERTGQRVSQRSGALMDGDILAGRNGGVTLETLAIPGTEAVLEVRRTDSGRLIGLRAGGRSYLHATDDGARVFGDGLAVFRDLNLPRGLIRDVAGGGDAWSEEYTWDAGGRPIQVDGVTIDRDEDGHVIACRGGGTAWHYGYVHQRLAVIDGPFGIRHITRGANGRPVAVRQGSQVQTPQYDDSGIRLDIPAPPSSWHRDTLGRLWTITRADGSVATTYLWNGFACLGRVDGAPGEPLAAVFSLDLSCTPVRAITADGMQRLPRDAFGEGLLGIPGIPGLYGGAAHGGFVHMRGRVLDPASGAFDRPDPFDGLTGDPRRDDDTTVRCQSSSMADPTPFAATIRWGASIRPARSLFHYC